MNPIAKEISTNIVSGQGLQQKTTWADLLIVLSMSVYSILVFGNIGGAVGGAGMLLLATLTYFAAMYVFYGVTVLAYKRRTLLLWTGVGAAFLLGYTFAGLNNLWSLLTAWSMFFAAGVIAGRRGVLDRPRSGQRKGRHDPMRKNSFRHRAQRSTLSSYD